MGWGDEIMVTGQVRVMHERDPRRVRVLDAQKRTRSHAIWAGNPRIASLAEYGDLQHLLNGPGVRPYIAEKTAERWVWRDWDGPHPGEIYFSRQERAHGEQFAGRVILEPNLKAKASPNKDWGWVRWNKLAWILQDRLGLLVTQVGPYDTRMLDGAELIVTRDFREACAVVSTARACVLPEGGLHHAAAATGTPAVVIFGGYIAPRHTGYAGHINLFTGGEACGMRVACSHCAEAMAKITPEHVADRLMEILSERTRAAAAA